MSPSCPDSDLDDGVEAGVQLEEPVESFAYVHAEGGDVEGGEEVAALAVRVIFCHMGLVLGEQVPHAQIRARVEAHPRPVEVGEPDAGHQGEDEGPVHIADKAARRVGVYGRAAALHGEFHTHLAPVVDLVVIV